MKIEILDFIPEVKDSSKVYGFLKICIKDSFTTWLVVFKSEKHGYFFKPPSIFIEKKFIPAYEFLKTDVIKEANKQLHEEFKRKYG